MDARYRTWMQRYGRVFGLQTPADGEMLAEWCRLFEADGVEPAELEAVTDWLARNDPPRYRTGHLALIQARLKAARQEASRPPDVSPPEDPRGQCVLCRGAGRVVVPVLPGLRTVGGHLYREGDTGTCAVLCRCPLGQWYADRQKGLESPPLTLAAYERLCPGWQDVLRQQTASLQAWQQASEHAGTLDRTLGEILRRARQSVQEKE